VRVLLAISAARPMPSSTLTAIAGRAGMRRSTCNRLNELSDTTPVLVNLKPVGNNYMEDFFAAGGVPAVLRELRDLLHLDCLSVTGQTLRELIDAPLADSGRPRDHPKRGPSRSIPMAGSSRVFGNRWRHAAPSSSAPPPRSGYWSMKAAPSCSPRRKTSPPASTIPALDVGPDDILVLQNAGPKSAAAMPEAGYLPIPRKLAAKGVKDMVRISDARMSGTAYGAIVLHVAPEAAVGGPLALVRNGDRIRLSVRERRIELLVGADEMARREAESPGRDRPAKRGYARLYEEQVLQADDGCDFDFLRSQSPQA
jgi:dihydroxy-acid dehydratase